jgi:hypothetical protein
MIGGRPGVVRRRRIEILTLVSEVDREPRAGFCGLCQHHLGKRLRQDLTRRIVRGAEQHQARMMQVEQPGKFARRAGRIALGQI